MEKYLKKILIVEDEALIAASEAQTLRKRGYKVFTAVSGEKAFELLRSTRVDLILMDIDLGPGQMDGTETAIRVLGEYEVPIVFLSSHTEPEIVEKTEKITSYGYVVKTSGENVLDTSIKMAFKLFAAHQEVRTHKAESEEAVRRARLREERLKHINRVLLSIRNVNQLITMDLPREELLDETCRFLVEQNGYFNAWVILLENGRPIEPFFHKGFEDNCFQPMTEKLQAGYLPQCAEKALSTGELVISEDPQVNCTDCPLRAIPSTASLNSMGNKGSVGMTARIEHKGTTYGWLSVSIPSKYAGDAAEHDLFREIINDLGSALHKETLLREREQAFHALHKSERTLENVFNSIQDGISLLDVDLNIIRTNQVMKEWYAANLPLEGKKCYRCYHNNDSPCDPCPSLRCLQSGKTEVEVVAGLPGSPVEWVELFSYPVINPESGQAEGVVEFVRDITSRINAEDQLHKSRENLRATLNSIGDAVIATDINGRVERMNPVAERLTGWMQTEAVGKLLPDVFHIIHAHTDQSADNPVEKVLKSGKVVGLANHTMLISRNGTRYQIADSGAPIRSADGKTIGVVLVFRDVTEEYRMREELRQNEDRLSKILTAANDGTWDWDLTTDHVYFDRRYYEMAGYAADEFPHQIEEFQKRVHPDDVAEVMKTAERHLKGELERFEVEFRFAKKGGGWIWILGRGFIVERAEDGTPLRFVGTHTDISVRKQIEENLRTERRRLADVLEGTNVGSWEWNVQTGETIFNERWAEIVGYTLDEISPTSIQTWIDFTHPDDLKRSNQLLEQHFRRETDYYECEARMQHKDGHWVWVLDRGKISVWTDEGMPLLVSGTHQDITERKQAEAALHASLQEKQNLLSELQHRVKNSFSLILSMFSLKSADIKSQEARETLHTISTRVRALAELYSLLHQSGSIQDVALNEYGEKVAVSMRQLSDIVRIESEIEEITVSVRLAATIGLIITELVTNAISHAYPDGAAGWVAISLNRSDAGVRLVVENGGRALPDGFDLSSSKGIGLQLVQALAEQHQGRFDYQRGRTTKMIVELKLP
ncbi:MAG: PAS domain S-box protein [Spirochaetota bacterium]